MAQRGRLHRFWRLDPKTERYVSNELGLGLVPSDELSRHFRNLHGNLNQAVAFLRARDDVIPECMAVGGGRMGSSVAMITAANDAQLHTVMMLSPGLSYLGPELGHVSSSDPTHVHWDGDGWKARLDHAALALIIEAE